MLLSNFDIHGSPRVHLHAFDCGSVGGFASFDYVILKLQHFICLPWALSTYNIPQNTSIQFISVWFHRISLIQYSSVQYGSVWFNSFQFSLVQFGLIQVDSFWFHSFQFSSVWFHSIWFDSIPFHSIWFLSIPLHSCILELHLQMLVCRANCINSNHIILAALKNLESSWAEEKFLGRP